MSSIVLATQNKKKARELADLAHGRFTVRSLDDVGLAALVIHETGATFAANARIKVDAVYAALSAAERARTYAIVGDDSGLMVDAIDGRPAVRSARFAADAGTGTGDSDNNRLLLLMLNAVPEPLRAARLGKAASAADEGQNLAHRLGVALEASFSDRHSCLRQVRRPDEGHSRHRSASSWRCFGLGS